MDRFLLIHGRNNSSVIRHVAKFAGDWKIEVNPKPTMKTFAPIAGIIVLVLALFIGTASAQIKDYTSAAAYDAATTTSTNVTFDSAPPYDISNSYSEAGITITDTAEPNSESLGVNLTTENGEYWDGTPTAVFGAESQGSIVVPSGTTAVGFQTACYQTGPLVGIANNTPQPETFEVYLVGNTTSSPDAEFTAVENPIDYSPMTTFFGVTSGNADIAEVVVSESAIFQTEIDNVQVGNKATVPEPCTWPLLLGSLGLLAFWRMRSSFREPNCMSIKLFSAVFAALFSLLSTSVANAQVYVADPGNYVVGEYALDGTPINPSLISGLNQPEGIAVSGNKLYVSNNNTIGEYNATTGAPIKASFIVPSQVSDPRSIVISDGDLFASYGIDNTIGKYNATTGATVNSTFITDLSDPTSIAVSGSTLYVADGNLYDNSGSNKVGEYNATTGAVINASFISGLDNPISLAISGDILFVGTPDGIIGEYNATTGAAINSGINSGTAQDIAILGDDLFTTDYVDSSINEFTFSGSDVNYVNSFEIADHGNPVGIAIGAVPEPSTYALMLGGHAFIVFCVRRKCALVK